MAAFFGFIGVFLVASGALETRDAIELRERRIEARQRATEAQLKAPGLTTLSARDQRALEDLNLQLYVELAVAAVALLLALLIAVTDLEPRGLALGLVALALAMWLAVGIVAPALPLFVAAFVAHVPDRVWNPRQNPDP